MQLCLIVAGENISNFRIIKSFREIYQTFARDTFSIFLLTHFNFNGIFCCSCWRGSQQKNLLLFSYISIPYLLRCPLHIILIFLSPQSCSGNLYWQMIAAIPVAEARIPAPQSLPAAVEPDGGGHRQLSMSRGNKNCGCYSVNEGIGKDKASLIAQ